MRKEKGIEENMKWSQKRKLTQFYKKILKTYEEWKIKAAKYYKNMLNEGEEQGGNNRKWRKLRGKYENYKMLNLRKISTTV